VVDNQWSAFRNGRKVVQKRCRNGAKMLPLWGAKHTYPAFRPVARDRIFIIVYRFWSRRLIAQPSTNSKSVREKLAVRLQVTQAE